MSTYPQPIAARFRSRVELTIHGGFLATAGALQCDPVAKVHLVTVKKLWKSTAALDSGAPNTSAQARRSRSSSPLNATTRKPRSSRAGAPAAITSDGDADAQDGARNGNKSSNTTGGIGVTISARTVATTKPTYFTARPNFEETVSFDVEDNDCLTSLASKAPSFGAAKPSAESVEDFIAITIEDATAGSEKFYGEVYCPFSPHCPSTALPTAPVRVMLHPRNVQDPSDPLFQKDMAVLRAHKLDDFGFLTISWRVRMIPHGGAIVKATSAAEAPSTQAEAPTFPLGLTLKARWQAPPGLGTQADVYFTTSVDFGTGSDRFVFTKTPALQSGAASHHTQQYQPLFLTIRSAAQLLNAMTFHCDVQSITSGSHEVAVDIPLPSLATKAALDRDVHWTAPVRTTKGDDLGLLFATVRLSSRPLEGNTPACADPECPRINDPKHQEEATHVAKDWTAAAAALPALPNGATSISPLPDAPFSAYQPLLWESAGHIAKAAERAWKRGVVLDAQPTPAHVRHIFDVLMGRVQLDAGVARVATAFFNRTTAEITAADLKEFMVACAFNGRGLSVVEAARFCFVALRRDVEDAVAAEEVIYMLTHALIGKTVDMSEGELKRWVLDIIGDAPAVSFKDFTHHVLQNEAVWAAFGVPVYPDTSFSSAQHHHHYFQREPIAASARSVGGAAAVHRDAAAGYTAPPPFPTSGNGAAPSLPPPQQQKEQQHQASVAFASLQNEAAALEGPNSRDSGNVWRTFVVRVPQTKKAFSVTAHVSDTIASVKKMVEGSTGIAAGRQDWWLDGESLLDGRTVVGSTKLGLPSVLKTAQTPATSGPAATGEVWIRESEEAVVLHFHYKARNKKWTEKLPVTEKVLKVRASVQRHTLIPLSRCVLKVVSPASGRNADVLLADRHPISYYKLQSGDVIEVSQE